MMKLAGTVAGALGLLAVTGAILDIRPAYSDKQIVIESSVKVGEVPSGKKDPIYFCSGVVIEDPDMSDGDQFTVLTAAHCTEPKKVGEIMYVKLDDGREVSMMIRKQGGEAGVIKTDLALLQAMKAGVGEDIIPVPVSEDVPSLGDPVVTVGFPLIGDPDATKVYESGHAGREFTFPGITISDYFQKTTLIVTGGASGSGAFNSDFELTNILSIARRDVANHSGWVPLRDIREFLNLND